MLPAMIRATHTTKLIERFPNGVCRMTDARTNTAPRFFDTLIDCMIHLVAREEKTPINEVQIVVKDPRTRQMF